MKKTIIIVTSLIVILVIAFFVFEIIKGVASPCETIFEQTSVQLRGKLKAIKTQGEVFIGKDKIQELSETAQVTALNLKTCCIVLIAGNVDSNQFLQCKDTAKKYETKVDAVLVQIEAAESAKKDGEAEVIEESIRAVNLSVNDVTRIAEEFQSQVDTLSGDDLKKETRKKKVQAATHPPSKHKSALESGLKLTTILSETSEPLERDLKYYVYKAKKDVEGDRVEVAHSYRDAAPLFRLPAGRYYVWVDHGQANTSTEVKLNNHRLKPVGLNNGLKVRIRVD